jgi:hypothetical protein
VNGMRIQYYYELDLVNQTRTARLSIDLRQYRVQFLNRRSKTMVFLLGSVWKHRTLC